jgi:hypothetical protein
VLHCWALGLSKGRLMGQDHLHPLMNERSLSQSSKLVGSTAVLPYGLLAITM